MPDIKLDTLNGEGRTCSNDVFAGLTEGKLSTGLRELELEECFLIITAGERIMLSTV